MNNLMQPADLLPFASKIHKQQYGQRWLRACDYLIRRDGKEVSRNEPLLHARSNRLMESWERQGMLLAFGEHHYQVGSVFDYNGVQAMVEATEIRIGAHGKYLGVTAVIRSPKGGLERLELGENMALALVWRKFNIENA